MDEQLSEDPAEAQWQRDEQARLAAEREAKPDEGAPAAEQGAESS